MAMIGFVNFVPPLSNLVRNQSQMINKLKRLINFNFVRTHSCCVSSRERDSQTVI
jgi:hypothetical protein